MARVPVQQQAFGRNGAVLELPQANLRLQYWQMGQDPDGYEPEQLWKVPLVPVDTIVQDCMLGSEVVMAHMLPPSTWVPFRSYTRSPRLAS